MLESKREPFMINDPTFGLWRMTQASKSMRSVANRVSVRRATTRPLPTMTAAQHSSQTWPALPDLSVPRDFAPSSCLLPRPARSMCSKASEGSIGFEKRGNGGFGFDPVFRVAGDTRHMAELSAEEKHRISHRGLAAQQVIRFLQLNR